MILDVFTPEAVRTQCNALLALAEQDRLRCLRFSPDRLDHAADTVTAVTRERFPDLRVPFHSRWRHFTAGGINRRDLYPAEPAARLELCVLSVLLDAGAGPHWTYREPDTGLSLTRSEGLAVAGLHALRSNAIRADAAFLSACSATVLAEAFQASETNPLDGLIGRAALMRRLGAALHEAKHTRLADLFTTLRTGAPVTARDIFVLVLRTLRPIWPRPEGDVWQHPDIGPVPLHKLSQWLSYSLVETLQMEGITVTGLDALTGLAEYRNGGLFLDSGVLSLRDPSLAEQTLPIDHPTIIEWRAMTVALLDRLAPMIRSCLGTPLSLGQILEGGTWEAGRRLAQQRRGDLSPPLRIISDGSVF